MYMGMEWECLSEKALSGGTVSRGEALAVLKSGEDEILAVMNAAFKVRLRHFGRGMNLQVLQNAKSGLCSENCAFCSQSAVADSGIAQYPMKSVEEIVEGAREAKKLNAVRYCIVTSNRSPSSKDLETVCEAVRRIKKEMSIQVCTSLGLLTPEQARTLADAGVNRYNHNFETSLRYYPSICQTHTYEDRVRTVKTARQAGLEICCGGLIGMGETLEDRVELAFAVKDGAANSIPVNFLDPRAGTPLADRSRLKPTDCLRTLAMFRLVNPSSEIRIAGGREACLRRLQPLALYAANSIFTEGYLTTPGQGYSADIAMIEEAGFEIAQIEA